MLNNLLNALLYWVSGWLRCRLIKIKDEPYLERYWVCSLFGRHVYLHRFLDSDNPDQGVHDHPWTWSLSFILCGMYVEHRRWGNGTLKRWLNYIGGDHFHLVALVPGVYAWSLFIAGPPKPGRVWGMLRRVYPDLDAGWRARGDAAFVFVPYDYNPELGNNPPPGQWWRIAPRGRHVARERRDYVRSK